MTEPVDRRCVLVLDGDGALVVTRTGLVDRLRAAVRAHEADRLLARGVAPDTGAVLALRARQLVDPRTIDALARALGRLLDGTHLGSSRGRVSAAVAHPPPAVLHGPLLELIGALSTTAPDVRHLARLMLLVTDAGSPLFRGDLGTRLAVVRGLTADLRSSALGPG